MESISVLSAQLGLYSNIGLPPIVMQALLCLMSSAFLQLTQYLVDKIGINEAQFQIGL